MMSPSSLHRNPSDEQADLNGRLHAASDEASPLEVTAVFESGKNNHMSLDDFLALPEATKEASTDPPAYDRTTCRSITGIAYTGAERARINRRKKAMKIHILVRPARLACCTPRTPRPCSQRLMLITGAQGSALRRHDQSRQGDADPLPQRRSQC